MTRFGAADVRKLAAAVGHEPEGNRNRLLLWAFCGALRSGYDLRPIVEAALQCGQTRGRPPEEVSVGERFGLEQNA